MIGLYCLCPACYAQNGGEVGTHALRVLTPDADPDDWPLPGRWRLIGDTFDELTAEGANGGSSSILLAGSPCRAHFFIRDGEVVFA